MMGKVCSTEIASTVDSVCHAMNSPLHTTSARLDCPPWSKLDLPALSSRALSRRNTSYLIYRGDRISFTSHQFIARMRTHGFHTIDFPAYAAKRTSAPWRPTNHKKDAIAMTLAIEEFRKTGNNY
jgi:hypothetical protein